MLVIITHFALVSGGGKTAEVRWVISGRNYSWAIPCSPIMLQESEAVSAAGVLLTSCSHIEKLQNFHREN